MHNLTSVWLSLSPPSTFLALPFTSPSVCHCCLCAFLVHQPLHCSSSHWCNSCITTPLALLFLLVEAALLGAGIVFSVWQSLGPDHSQQSGRVYWRPADSSLLGWLSVLHFIAPGFCKLVCVWGQTSPKHAEIKSYWGQVSIPSRMEASSVVFHCLSCFPVWICLTWLFFVSWTPEPYRGFLLNLFCSQTVVQAEFQLLAFLPDYWTCLLQDFHSWTLVK